jgi:hypothetical protein
MPAAPAPTITISADPERGCSERGAPFRDEGAARTGPAANAAADAVRNVRRLNGFMRAMIPFPTLPHLEASGKPMGM